MVTGVLSVGALTVPKAVPFAQPAIPVLKLHTEQPVAAPMTFLGTIFQ